MNKLLKLSLMAVLLFSAVSVYADGNMSTGNRTCTENCGLVAVEPTTAPADTKKDESIVSSILDWIKTSLSDVKF